MVIKTEERNDVLKSALAATVLGLEYMVEDTDLDEKRLRVVARRLAEAGKAALVE